MRSLPNRLILCAFLILALAIAPASGQQPIDVFPDDPPLDAGFIRIGSWNLRHINLEGGARQFLAGANDTEDFAILTATFAKAIRDLGLDLVAIQEFQPRAMEPNRLHQIRDHLNGGASGPWRSDETNIPYDNPNDQFGNLQFGVLWNSSRVTIDPNADLLLSELRQPRNQAGELTEQRMRIPWLVPVQAGNLSFDLMILHLKSGGDPPQAEEVNALERFVRQRQTAPQARHLIICGDWNIRPDQPSGRGRLRQMMVPDPGGNLMRVLTVEEIRPTLEGWEGLGAIPGSSPLAGLVPFSHFNASTLDTFLDHVAISRTLDEIFDHPIQVRLSGGTTDLSAGIRAARPLIPEESYVNLTDHLPLVMTLRTDTAAAVPPPPSAALRIVATLPNPVGDDAQDEEVHLQNTSGQAVTLTGWRIGDASGSFWPLQAADGTVQPGATVIVRRRARSMSLNNTGGDTITLINPAGATVDQKSYSGTAASGQLFTFN